MSTEQETLPRMVAPTRTISVAPAPVDPEARIVICLGCMQAGLTAEGGAEWPLALQPKAIETPRARIGVARG